MKLIELTQGKFAVVDDEDYEYISMFKWHLSYSGYVASSVYNPETKRSKHLLMHRFLTPCPKGKQVDHIDGDRLNNCRDNLRICTLAENRSNSGRYTTNTSGHRGIQWRSDKKKWRARIFHDKKEYFLGYFADKDKAVEVWRRVAKLLYGEFVNFDRC